MGGLRPISSPHIAKKWPKIAYCIIWAQQNPTQTHRLWIGNESYDSCDFMSPGSIRWFLHAIFESGIVRFHRFDSHFNNTPTYRLCLVPTFWTSTAPSDKCIWTILWWKIIGCSQLLQHRIDISASVELKCMELVWNLQVCKNGKKKIESNRAVSEDFFNVGFEK